MTVPEEKRAGYISLKEASERFGYSQDYLGQLIRKGKLDGKLVYSHVAWVTTPEAVEQYITQSKDKKKKKQDNMAEDVADIVAPHFDTEADVDDSALHAPPHTIDDEESRLGGWLIVLFRILTLVVLIVAVFVFYLLTTAFGEEVRSGDLMSASTTFSLSVDNNHHE